MSVTLHETKRLMYLSQLKKIKDKVSLALIKTISYRFFASSLTFIIVYIQTGHIEIGLTLSLLELIFKPFLYFFHEIVWLNIQNIVKSRNKNKVGSTNLTEELLPVSKLEKEASFKQKGISIWFTGLSGSGKSTLAKLLEKKLFELGYKTVLLDGDNTRLNLNRDLGFSLEDRQENIRRIAEVSKLLNDAGIITIPCFISPTNEIRDLAKSIIGESNFYLVHTNSSVATCIARDPKGLYKKAIENKIPDFTGISSPFERPSNVFLDISTEDNIDASFAALWEKILDICKLEVSDRLGP